MAQHDYVIDNQSAPASRTDINNVLQAILTHNSGATAPSTTVANMMWYDTSTDLLKMRNEANSGWITLGTVDQTNNVFNPNFLPATQAEAEAGTDNVKGMTPLRVSQEITAKVGVANAAPVKTAINAGGSAPIYAARAWVNFNGTGTVAIRGSGNVTSITDNGVGDYTINFTTAMPDVNYAVVGSEKVDNTTATANQDAMVTPFNLATGSVRLHCNDDGTLRDTENTFVVIYR
jgi:hypothetical protein